MYIPLELLCGKFIREILTGRVPYNHLSEAQIIGAVGFDESHKLKLPTGVSFDPKFSDLINKCLSRSPNNRPRFEEIVKELATIREEIKTQGKINRNNNKRIGRVFKWIII